MINLTREKKVIFAGWFRYGIATILFIFLSFFLFLREEVAVPSPVRIQIEAGSALGDISHMLEEENLINSETLFNLYTLLTGNAQSLKSGTYIFEKAHSIPEILDRLIVYDTQVERVAVTFPEGFTRAEMAVLLEETFSDFDRLSFLDQTREGYLFPDTYTFFETVPVPQIIEELEMRHSEIIAELMKTYSLPEGFTEEDWIILASIVEKEANTAESRRMVADILLRRLEVGMALQVDATFVYGVQKDSFTLTTEDLLEDHEYNTYTRKELPPTPISNPGEDALRSVLEPILNTAVYFLTGLDGVMYYADTYDGHLDNRRLYLNK